MLEAADRTEPSGDRLQIDRLQIDICPECRGSFTKPRSKCSHERTYGILRRYTDAMRWLPPCYSFALSEVLHSIAAVRRAAPKNIRAAPRTLRQGTTGPSRPVLRKNEELQQDRRCFSNSRMSASPTRPAKARSWQRALSGESLGRAWPSAGRAERFQGPPRPPPARGPDRTGHVYPYLCLFARIPHPLPRFEHSAQGGDGDRLPRDGDRLPAGRGSPGGQPLRPLPTHGHDRGGSLFGGFPKGTRRLDCVSVTYASS